MRGHPTAILLALAVTVSYGRVIYSVVVFNAVVVPGIRPLKCLPPTADLQQPQASVRVLVQPLRSEWT